MNFNLLNLIKGIKISDIASGANKTLNVIKKSIPVYKEIRPYVNREKSLFKNNNKIKDIDEIKESKPLKSNNKTTYNDSLTFFN